MTMGYLMLKINCPDTYNADQADFDNDGIGNACDNCPTTLTFQHIVLVQQHQIKQERPAIVMLIV